MINRLRLRLPGYAEELRRGKRCGKPAGIYDIEVAIKYKENVGNFIKNLIYF